MKNILKYNTTNTHQNQQHKPNKQRHTQPHLSPNIPCVSNNSIKYVATIIDKII